MPPGIVAVSRQQSHGAFLRSDRVCMTSWGMCTSRASGRGLLHLTSLARPSAAASRSGTSVDPYACAGLDVRQLLGLPSEVLGCALGPQQCWPLHMYVCMYALLLRL